MIEKVELPKELNDILECTIVHQDSLGWAIELNGIRISDYYRLKSICEGYLHHKIKHWENMYYLSQGEFENFMDEENRNKEYFKSMKGMGYNINRKTSTFINTTLWNSGKL